VAAGALQRALCKVGGHISQPNAKTDLSRVSPALRVGGRGARVQHLSELVLKQDAVGLIAICVGIGEVVGNDIQVFLVKT